ncbi:hypothetical protein [Dethiosulfatarculus sandiegensis]|uniref:Uncharacterized protein n=1 Tax=Dethiosulfatarculus sandiegensis TaxID=1429043 RepID=A0A0D2JA96_9BACT|nr:hypothetical protein [Dethiosulfatarculus sandiegensis]KIX15059.1 hypothetical protein X474_06015 [Dethiosulfatarculus sandiegensis]
MSFKARKNLREFYDQALLAPDLLCLNCAHTAWNRAACRCSAERKEDCLLFAGDMVNMLNGQLAQLENRADKKVTLLEKSLADLR